MSYYIIIRGPLGCGKSTISKELAKRINGEYISVDQILAENDLENDKEEGYISQSSFKKANEIAVNQSSNYLSNNKQVIFDGNFYWKSQVEDLIERLDLYKSYVFTLKVPLEVCIERDSKRNPPHGEGAARVVYKKTTEFDYGEIIDATLPVEKSIGKIISSIENETNKP